MRRLLWAAGLLAAWPALAQVSVRDGMGQTVSLPQPAQRIVALAPHLVEDLYAIGAERQLAAAVDYSDYPPAARQLPRVGGYSGISLEAVLRQQPDLVVAWRDGGNGRELARLRELGVPVYISAPVALVDVASELRRLGTLTGRVAPAEAAARRYESGLQQLLAERRAGFRVKAVYWRDATGAHATATATAGTPGAALAATPPRTAHAKAAGAQAQPSGDAVSDDEMAAFRAALRHADGARPGRGTPMPRPLAPQDMPEFAPTERIEDHEGHDGQGTEFGSLSETQYGKL